MNVIKLAKAGCVFVVCLLSGILSYAQPTANFTAGPTSGCAPLLVTFTDQSIGNPTSWRWDFGDGTIGNTSNNQNPSRIYYNPGVYSVKLVVTNAAGSDSIVRTQYINVYAKPVVDFSASAYLGCPPMTVSFTDLSTPGSGSIASWSWDLGNGTSSTLQNPTIIYNNTGLYSVSLVVTNTFGCVKALTKDTIIKITNKPTASFNIGNTANCGAPLSVDFTNQSTGSGNLNYLWQFGDGSTSNDQNPSHTYVTTGTFSPRLIVTNAGGCSDTLIRSNAISIMNNITSFTTQASVCANSNLSITNGSSPAPVSVVWNFGDGTSSTDPVPVKTYTTPGTYQITMINNYGICIDSMTRTINVLPQPTSDFNASPTSACYAPLAVNFTNNSSNGISYLWNFGTGATSTLANPNYSYTTQGDYNVTLTVTAANGCTATFTRNQYINIHLPVVSIDSLPRKGCAPFTWTFRSRSYGGDSIVSYNWNFGDGTTSNLPRPTHVFDSGSYTIVLSIVTASGCTDTVTYTNGIRVGMRPDANFSATPRNTCAQIPVVFTDMTTPAIGITEWLWDFGDGGVSSSQNPQHTYTDTGSFSVQLIAFNNGCPDTLVIPDYVYINPPIAKFVVKFNCSNRLRRQFIDSSIGADTWLWNFGDGTTSTLQNPVHDYPTTGVYNISLTVHNNLSGCDYTKTGSINVINQFAGISASDTNVCKCNPVTFTATNVTNSNFNNFRWSFGDNTIGNGSPINKIYCIPGIYSIRLITLDKNGCKDTVIRPNYIKVNGPSANFGAVNSSICSNGTVTFSDSSRSDGRNGLKKWIWNFGDGQTDTTLVRTTSHTYTTGGVFSVTLTVIDSSDCSDTKTRANLVTVFRPYASFNTFDSVSCPNANVVFNNTSTGSGLTYLWYFGDGTTSTQQNPSHSYPRNGTYTVRLIVFDQNGCSDTTQRINYVTIVTPVANFTVSDSVGACPPLLVNFTNTSTNYNSISWNFGDNNSSVEAAPSHLYNVSGTFSAMLTITGPGGCTSRKVKNIIVHGPRGSFNYGGLTGCVPMTVNFSANVVQTNSFVWDYSDGTTNITPASSISHVYNTPGAFLPKVILRDSAGCIVPIMGRDTIRIYDITAGFSFNSQAQCNQGTVMFTNTSQATEAISGYTWNFGDGSAVSTVSNPSHAYTGTGLYHPMLIATSAHGCTDTMTSSIPVRIVANPQGLIDQSANGCVDLTVRFNGRLSVPDTSAITWAWDFGNGQNSTLMNPVAQSYSTAGTYPVRLLITNSSGCKDTVTSTVEAYAIPVIDAGIDTMVCKGSGTTLHATGGNTYTWSPATALSCTNCASPVASPVNPIQYLVTGTSIHGCVNRDSVKVSVKYPFTMTVSRKDSLCIGSSLRLNASGASTYVWSPSTGLDNPNSAAPLASPSISTTYQVIGTDDRNCFKDTAYVPVVVFNNPTVEAGLDRTINVGQTIDLMPQVSSDVIDARWSPTNSIFRDIFPGITVKPLITTTYTVVVKNSGGCTASDQLTVHVLCNDANMFIPNTFSPNGDGMNDVFYPRGSGIFTIKNIKIFSRWGELLFERSHFNANDLSKAWDGTFKGKKLNPDVFVYLVDVICEDNTVLSFKGNVALIK